MQILSISSAATLTISHQSFFDIYCQTWYNTTLWLWALVEMFCHLYLTALSMRLNLRLLKPAPGCHYCKRRADNPVPAVFNPGCTDRWVSEVSADILTWCVEVSACRWDKITKQRFIHWMSECNKMGYRRLQLRKNYNTWWALLKKLFVPQFHHAACQLPEFQTL